MKKSLFFLILVGVTFSGCNSSHHYGNYQGSNNMGAGNVGALNVSGGSQTFNGSARLHNSSYERLSVNGSANLTGVIVSDFLKVNGSLDAVESNIHSLESNGRASLQNTTVSGLCEVRGYLHATSSILGDVSMCSTRVTLINSQTKTIRMKRTGSYQPHIVELIDTVVDGDVIFDNEDGKVLLKGSSKITGKVVGGVLEK